MSVSAPALVGASAEAADVTGAWGDELAGAADGVGVDAASRAIAEDAGSKLAKIWMPSGVSTATADCTTGAAGFVFAPGARQISSAT